MISPRLLMARSNCFFFLALLSPFFPLAVWRLEKRLGLKLVDNIALGKDLKFAVANTAMAHETPAEIMKEIQEFEGVEDPGVIKVFANVSSGLIFEWFPPADILITE
jgi:hypothetical protein